MAIHQLSSIGATYVPPLVQSFFIIFSSVLPYNHPNILIHAQPFFLHKPSKIFKKKTSDILTFPQSKGQQSDILLAIKYVNKKWYAKLRNNMVKQGLWRIFCWQDKNAKWVETQKKKKEKESFSKGMDVLS